MEPYWSNGLSTIYNSKCESVIEEFIKENRKFDLIVTDPPYLIENTTGGQSNELGKSMRNFNEQLESGTFTEGINNEILEKLLLLQDKTNIYIWCNHKQIPQYLDFFVGKNGCKFDIIIWNKTNAMPTFNNKYLTDKEYCLYFRDGGYCNPKDYDRAKTVYSQPINIEDKTKYGHPTIKPLNIIRNIIDNSTKEGDTVLDIYAGSFTTCVASEQLNIKSVGIEMEKEYCDIGIKRLKEVQIMFDI